MHDPNEHVIIDAALNDLRRQYPTLNRLDVEGHRDWEQAVGFWLVEFGTGRGRSTVDAVPCLYGLSASRVGPS